MALSIGGREFSAGRVAGITALAVSLGVGGFFAIDAAATDGSRTGDDCVDDVAQLADEQAQRIEEFGEDAPIFDFNFPESCFE